MQLHAKYSTNTQGFHAWVFTHLHLPPTCHVLEVGCGTGQLWLENHQGIPAGWDVTLSDLSAGILATAQHQLSPYGHAFRFVV
jgi:SAM-dependent methyltransferase